MTAVKDQWERLSALPDCFGMHALQGLPRPKQAPWRLGDWVFATDGYLFVAVRSKEPASKLTSRHERLRSAATTWTTEPISSGREVAYADLLSVSGDLWVPTLCEDVPQRPLEVFGTPINAVYLAYGLRCVPPVETVQVGKIANQLAVVAPDWRILLAPLWRPSSGVIRSWPVQEVTS